MAQPNALTLLMPPITSDDQVTKVVNIHMILSKLNTLYCILRAHQDITNLQYNVRRTSCFYDILLAQTIYGHLRLHTEIPEEHERELELKICSIIRSIVDFYGIPGFYDFSNPDFNPLPTIDPSLTYGQGQPTVTPHSSQARRIVQHNQSHHGIQYQRIHHTPIRVSIGSNYRQTTDVVLPRQPRTTHQPIS